MRIKKWIGLAAFAIAVQSSLGKEIPEGFTLQELKPLGGELLVPKNWHFKSTQSPTGFTYTASKEPPENYQTGHRIQVVIGVEPTTGESAESVAHSARDQFKAKAITVIKECAEETNGYFQKICLETEEANPKNPEDPFHIIYTFAWNNSWDMLVITIFGAPKSQWPEAEKLYKVSQSFVLINPKKAELQ